MLGIPCATTTKAESLDSQALGFVPPPTQRKVKKPSPNPRSYALSGDDPQDLVLIEAARQGDEPAFRRLVERYRTRALAAATRIVRDPHDAEDVVQDAFFRAHSNLERFQGQSSFFTWLYRIVKNLALDFLRASPHRCFEHDPGSLRAASLDDAELLLVSRGDAVEAVDFVWRRELASELQKALAALPSYHRDVVILCAVDEMSYEELSTKLKISRGTLMSRFFYARKKLHRALLRRYADEWHDV